MAPRLFGLSTRASTISKRDFGIRPELRRVVTLLKWIGGCSAATLIIELGSLVVFSTFIVGCNERSVPDTKSQPNVQPQHSKSDEDAAVVRRFVSDRLQVNPQSLDMKNPIADELDVVQVVMTLEELFRLEIPDRIIEKHVGAKLGERKCKPSPNQLVEIVKDSRRFASKE